MFFKNAMAICIKQAGQLVDLRLEFLAFVGVAHLLSVVRQFHYLRGADGDEEHRPEDVLARTARQFIGLCRGRPGHITRPAL